MTFISGDGVQPANSTAAANRRAPSNRTAYGGMASRMCHVGSLFTQDLLNCFAREEVGDEGL